MDVFLFWEERFYVREIFKQSHFIQLGYRYDRIFGGVSAANVYELAPVVVTATKTAESLEKVPASVSVVTAKDIEDHNYSSTAQALGQLPGIYLSPVADGGISMRGFGSANILVMVDGQPVNNGWNVLWIGV